MQFRTTIHLNPGDTSALYHLARILQAEGKISQAKDDFGQMRKLNEVKHSSVRVALLNTQGLKLTTQGHFSEAVTAFKQVLALNPSLAPAAHNLAIALAGGGKFREAIESFGHAIKVRPTLAVAQYGLAVLLSKEGDSTGAEREFCQACLLQTFVPQLWHANLPPGALSKVTQKGGTPL